MSSLAFRIPLKEFNVGGGVSWMTKVLHHFCYHIDTLLPSDLLVTMVSLSGPRETFYVQIWMGLWVVSVKVRRQALLYCQELDICLKLVNFLEFVSACLYGLPHAAWLQFPTEGLLKKVGSDAKTSLIGWKPQQTAQLLLVAITSTINLDASDMLPLPIPVHIKSHPIIYSYIPRVQWFRVWKM